MVVVLSSKTVPSKGFISSPTNKVVNPIKSYPSNTISTANQQRSEYVSMVNNYPTTVINQVSLNTQALANTINQHNKSVIASVSSLVSEMKNSLRISATKPVKDTSTIIKDYQAQIDNKDKITKDDVKIASDEISESIKDISKELRSILSSNIPEEKSEDDTRRLAKNIFADIFEDIQALFNSEFLNTLFSTIFTSIDINPSYIKYLESRIDNLYEVFETLSNGDYESIDDLFRALTSDKTSGDLISFILSLFSIVPLSLAAFKASHAKEYNELNILALRDAKPNIPTWLEIMSGVRQGVFSEKYMFDKMQDSGWSENDTRLLYDLSQNIPNDTYLFEMFRRGIISDRLLEGNLKANGYTDNWIENLKQLAYYVPTPQDVVRFSQRDVFDEELASLSGIFEGWDNPDYLEWAGKAGLTPDVARLYWAAHWFLPSVNQGYEMLQRGVIDNTQLQALFRAADIAPEWRDKLLQISYKVPTRVDNRNMFISGVIDEQRTLLNIKSQGYDDENANHLLNWYKDIKESKNDNTSEIKNLSQSVILKSVKAGIMDLNTAAKKLTELGYSSQDASLLLLLNNSEQALIDENDYLDRQKMRLRQVYEKGYLNRSISKLAAKQGLIDSGLSEIQAITLLNMIDIEYEIERKNTIIEQATKQYVGFEIDENGLRIVLNRYGLASTEIEKLIEDLEPFRNLRYRDLTLADIFKAYNAQIIDRVQLETQLRGNGYSDSDIDILIGIRGV